MTISHTRKTLLCSIALTSMLVIGTPGSANAGTCFCTDTNVGGGHDVTYSHPRITQPICEGGRVLGFFIYTLFINIDARAICDYSEPNN